MLKSFVTNDNDDDRNNNKDDDDDNNNINVEKVRITNADIFIVL